VIVFDLFLSFAISLSSVKIVVGEGGMEQEEEERQMTYGIYSEGPPTLWALIYLCISSLNDKMKVASLCGRCERNRERVCVQNDL